MTPKPNTACVLPKWDSRNRAPHGPAHEAAAAIPCFDAFGRLQYGDILPRNVVTSADDKPAVTAAQKEYSPLLKLPDYVRNRIYRLVLVSHLPLHIKRRPFPGEPSLLSTCKQIRNEAQLIFWTENTFQGRDALHVCNSMNRAPQVLYQRKLSVLLEWLDRIGKEKAQLIKTLLIDYDVDCQYNGHPEYASNWPATPKDIMQYKRRNLAAAARFAAIKGLRGLLFHGAQLEAIKPILVLKGGVGTDLIDQFSALWKKAMEEVIEILKAGTAKESGKPVVVI